MGIHDEAEGMAEEAFGWRDRQEFMDAIAQFTSRMDWMAGKLETNIEAHGDELGCPTFLSTMELYMSVVMAQAEVRGIVD